MKIKLYDKNTLLNMGLKLGTTYNTRLGETEYLFNDKGGGGVWVPALNQIYEMDDGEVYNAHVHHRFYPNSCCGNIKIYEVVKDDSI